MRRGWEKLKSRSGASILFAILVFMLCILAGTAALTAAAANTGRYTHLRAEQQKYLTVSSAAKLLRSQVAGKELVKTVTHTAPETTDYDGSITSTDFYTQIIQTKLEAATVGTGTDPIKLTVSDSDGVGPTFQDVKAELTINTNYSMTFKVYFGATEDYTMTVNIPAVVTNSNGTATDGAGGTVTTTVTTVEWPADSATIAYGG